MDSLLNAKDKVIEIFSTMMVLIVSAAAAAALPATVTQPILVADIYLEYCINDT